MKKIFQTILILMLMYSQSYGQYEKQISLMNDACEAPETMVKNIFTGFDCEIINGVYYFKDDDASGLFCVDYSEGYPIAGYIDVRKSKNMRKIKREYKKTSDQYYYFLEKGTREEGTFILVCSKR